MYNFYLHKLGIIIKISGGFLSWKTADNTII